MSYTKPDVFVTVTLEANSPVVPTPPLLPTMIGEHYHVVRDAYAGYVQASQVVAGIPYPALPKSHNDPSKKMAVDVTTEFAPRVDMILADGTKVDVTEFFTFGAKTFSKGAITVVHEGTGLPYSGALYVSYRCLSDQYSGVNMELLRSNSTEELVALFGPDSLGPANPLGYAMWNGFTHGGVGVAAVAIGALPDTDGSGRYQDGIDDIVLSYGYALEFLEAQEDVYLLVPLTHNDYVLDVVLAHVREMSSTLGRRERRMVFAPKMNDYWPVRADKTHKTWFSVKATTAGGRTYLNGGQSLEVRNITATAAGAGGVIRATSSAHGLTTGDEIELTGLSDAANGTYTVTVIDANTFELAATTWTGNETGTFKEPQSAIGTEIEASTGERILRIAAGDGSAHLAYVIYGVVPSGDTQNFTIDGHVLEVTYGPHTVDADGDGDTEPVRRAYVELSMSAFNPSNQRVRVGDFLHVEGTDQATKMGTIYFPGIGGTEALLEVTWEGERPTPSEIEGARSVVVYREAKAYEMTNGLRDMALSYDAERLVLLVPDTVGAFVSNENLDVPSYFLGAQLAGEMCRVGRVPAKEAPGALPFTALRDPHFKPFQSVRYFTETQLDWAAGGGVSWIVNRQKGLPLTTRHTLTTDSSTVELREAILGVERDFLAKTFRAGLREELRKYRIDSSLISILSVRAAAIARTLTRGDARTFREITIDKLYQDPNQPDQVIIEVSAVHLYPLNYIRVNVRIVV